MYYAHLCTIQCKDVVVYNWGQGVNTFRKDAYQERVALPLAGVDTFEAWHQTPTIKGILQGGDPLLLRPLHAALVLLPACGFGIL